jgi:Malectin domain/Immunoglobulin I-set domain
MQNKLVCLLIWIFLLGTASANAQSTIRVNVGGPAYTDSKGQAWSADFGFNSGNASNCAPRSTVKGSTDPFLFKSARVRGSTNPELQYTFPITNGSYIVNLYFSDPCDSVVGDRVFDVQLQGVTVFPALDIVQVVGLNHALIKSATVSVTNHQLTIRFVHRKDNPILAAIEIVPATAATMPAISGQPSSMTVTTGQTAAFSVTAIGTAPLSYQWRRAGAAISGATSSAYTTAATTSADNGAQFGVVVSNSKGTVTSGTATLTVNAAVVAPTITSQPLSQAVTTGQTATFKVAATGTAPLTYQWQRGGVAISGAKNSTYTTAATVISDNGAQLRVVVSNSKSSATSNAARLTVNPTAVAPTVSSQPANRTVTAGQTATFSVTASGTSPLSYQWQRGGVAISGATSSAYTTAATTSSINGAQFRAVVSNSKGTATSNAATLTVNPAVIAPAISSQPANQTATAGQTATFSVTASGTSPLSYQWQKNDSILNGATSATYTTPATTSADNGARFAVGVSNAAGSVTSSDATLSVTAPSAAVDVITYHNDNGRTGQNLKETTLTLSNVNQNTFGLRKIVTLDGKVDAQPLFLSGVAIAGGTHDVVYVVTEHDSAYALDSATGAVLWHVSTLSNGETTSDTHGCGQVSPEIGITSTPVIDRTRGPNGAIYVVAMSKNSNGSYFQRLYALDITSGAQLFGGPHTITATYPGTGDNSSGGNVIFDPGRYKERAGLLMIGGNIYTTWASHCDIRPYTGWIMSFDANSLAAMSVLNITPNGSEGAMWMAGAAPAADSSGNIFLLDGNGTMDTTLNGSGFPSKGDFGNCFCKISTSSGLQVADYFALSNTVSESNADTDLGSGAAMVLPDLSDGSGNTLHLALGAGKDGNIYVVNRDNMGKFDPNSNHIHQQLTGAITGAWSMAAYFNKTVYYATSDDRLKAFAITNGKLSGSPTSSATNTLGYPGATPSISANGSSNGIVWSYSNTSPAVLDAYDAANVSTQLYNSNQAANSRDQFGSGNKYMTPTIAKGRVYIGTASGIAIFGLLP